jgi:hypothetical protein
MIIPKWLPLLAVACLMHTAQAQQLTTKFETSQGKETVTYQEGMAFFSDLAAKYPNRLRLDSMGCDDNGMPIHLLTCSSNGQFDYIRAHQEGKTVLLVMNAIHPGEPDGVDACQLLLRDWLTGKYQLPENVVLGIIPFYNIDGALERNSHTRANQNGPASYGFRGNGQNLDLNRDFIKADSRNALAFMHIFRTMDPDIFVDTHVSNGADYQHVMTLLTTMYQKLGAQQGQFLHTQTEPALYKSMQQKGYDLVPYVNVWGSIPDSGWTAFYDMARFSSGYTTLFNTLGFVTETHMLKPFAQRVKATRAMLETFIAYGSTQNQSILSTRQQQRASAMAAAWYPINWKNNPVPYEWINFKGYTADHKPSEISGQPRLYYDRNKPFEKKVKHFNSFYPSDSVKVPEYFVLPASWRKVVERLNASGVQYTTLLQDSSITAEAYFITGYETRPKPYEGHYLHYNVQTESRTVTRTFHRGDLLIPVRQKAINYLMETLEPKAEDSFFAWGFFDPILQQKEYFSDYVFEDTGAAWLKEHPEVKVQLEQRKKDDPNFAKNADAQLDFVYRQSPWFEPSAMRYPLFRIMAR